MRKFLLLILLASAASPALAEPDSDGTPDRARNRAERAQSDSDAPRREVRPQREERVSEPRNLEPRANVGRSDGGRAETPRVEHVERRSASGEVRGWRRDSDASSETQARNAERGRPSVVVMDGANDAVAAGETVRPVRRRDGDGESVGSTIEDRVRRAPVAREGGGLVQPRRPLPRVMDPERRISPTPALGTEPPAPRTAVDRRANPARRWTSDWRHDRRYDWRNWRHRHRNRFHLGFYFDPFGWDYFRYGIGWRLWPSYYRSSYWLRDPWQYRLPPAYGPYRWIRYHNDALLVNVYTGNVVDVIYDFFW
jgi:Ni/Co efflux regulator RcnB